MNLTPDKSRTLAITITIEEQERADKLFAEHAAWFEVVKFHIQKGNGGYYLSDEDRNLFWRLLEYRARKKYKKNQVKSIADKT